MQLTTDQIELRDVVRRFLQEGVPSEYLRKRITSGLRRDDALIVSLKALGLEDGFSGAAPTLSFSDLALLSEEVGRALVPEPIVERLFLDCFLPHLLSDQSRPLFAALGGTDATTAYAPPACCKLSFNRKTKTVSGEITWAWGAEGAHRLIATVDEGKQKHLVALSLNQSRIVRSSVTSLDITIALSSFSLKDASVVVFSENESRLIEECMEALKASEVAGIAARAVEMTTEYVKTREQFGVPIGAFQAIQHRLADAYASSESLASLCRFTAWCVGSSPQQRSLTARAAISFAADAGPAICEAAIQCHGGIGFTWEYDLHLFLRRAKGIQAAYPLDAGRVEQLLERARVGTA